MLKKAKKSSLRRSGFEPGPSDDRLNRSTTRLTKTAREVTISIPKCGPIAEKKYYTPAWTLSGFCVESKGPSQSTL